MSDEQELLIERIITKLGLPVQRYDDRRIDSRRLLIPSPTGVPLYELTLRGTADGKTSISLRQLLDPVELMK